MIRNRKALLQAAEALIAKQGAERITIDEIAEAADLAKGTFYNYFEDKSAIVAELALVIRQALAGEVAAAQAGIEDPAARLAVRICVFLRCAARDPTRAAAVAHMYPQWLTPEAAGNARLRKDLEDGYRLGRFSSAALPAALVMTVGVVQAGMTRALALAEWNGVRNLASELCGLVLRGLGIKWNEAQSISAKAVARVFDERSKTKLLHSDNRPSVRSR